MLLRPLSHLIAVAHQQIQQMSSSILSSSSCWEPLFLLLLLWKAQFQESKRYKFPSYLGPDSRGEGFQYLEESVWREKYIFMEQTIKLYHHASRIKSSIQTKISQFYFPTSVYSCRELPSACNLEFQMRVALVTIKTIETKDGIIRFLIIQIKSTFMSTIL